jgi:predicted ATPase/transcriptional regulator with XRE-family HTH domain
MKSGGPRSFGAQLKMLREAAGFTQDELATIAGLSVHAVSALERGQRRRPHVETVRALSAAHDLAETVRDGFVASARAPAKDGAAAPRTAGSLPVVLTTLVGRGDDLDAVRLWLEAPGTRLITLTGPGGVGKTRLALELGRNLVATAACRVVFVGLAPVRNAAFVAHAIAEALGAVDEAAQDLTRLARLACEDTPALLLLDNFEHVLAAAPLIADLLTAAPTLRIMVTSRAPLRIRGEREYAVGPLELGAATDTLAPADIARAPAVRLFVERVRDVQPEFCLTDANSAVVMTICRRLDALPLAIELVAPWMKVLSAEDLLGRIGHKDVLLSTTGPRDLPERQLTINATVSWSYQLLAAEEKRAFRFLGVLPGPFAMDTAAAMLTDREGSSIPGHDALQAVAGLMDKSLLLRAENPAATRPLYRMLETVRAFAALELDAAGEREDALARLARHCVREATLAAQGLVGADQAAWLDRVRDDLESHRVALAWLIDRSRAREAAEIAWSLMHFWAIRGHAVEALGWYEQILTLPSLPSVAESKLLVGGSMMRYSLGDLTRARSGLIRAAALAHDAGDREMIAQAAHLLGHVEHASGHADAARDRFISAAAGFRALSIPWGLGNSLNGLAKVALVNGETTEAERMLDEATTVLRDCPWFLALVLYRRAVLAVQRRNANDAILLVRESLALFRHVQDKFAIVYVMVPLAAAAVLKDDDLWAARIFGARDAVTERTGALIADRWVQALGEQIEGEVRARLGPDRWARAHAAGRVTSIETFIKDIDAALRTVRR